FNQIVVQIKLQGDAIRLITLDRLGLICLRQSLVEVGGQRFHDRLLVAERVPLHLKRLARQGGGRFLDRRGNGWLREDLFDVPRLPLVLRRKKRAQPLGLFRRGILFPRGERAQARAVLARGRKLLLDLVEQIGERKLWIFVVDGAQRGGCRIVLRIFLGRWRLKLLELQRAAARVLK